MNPLPEIKAQQKQIIDSIQKEIWGADEFMKPSAMLHSVWFYFKIGRFLYNDSCIRYEVIEPLIEDGTLVFFGIEPHQGEQMARYVLTEILNR
jgi:hypothetical protein